MDPFAIFELNATVARRGMAQTESASAAGYPAGTGIAAEHEDGAGSFAQFMDTAPQSGHTPAPPLRSGDTEPGTPDQGETSPNHDLLAPPATTPAPPPRLRQGEYLQTLLGELSGTEAEQADPQSNLAPAPTQRGKEELFSHVEADNSAADQLTAVPSQDAAVPRPDVPRPSGPAPSTGPMVAVQPVEAAPTTADSRRIVAAGDQEPADPLRRTTSDNAGAQPSVPPSNTKFEMTDAAPGRAESGPPSAGVSAQKRAATSEGRAYVAAEAGAIPPQQQDGQGMVTASAAALVEPVQAMPELSRGPQVSPPAGDTVTVNTPATGNAPLTPVDAAPRTADQGKTPPPEPRPAQSGADAVQDKVSLKIAPDTLRTGDPNGTAPARPDVAAPPGFEARGIVTAAVRPAEPGGVTAPTEAPTVIVRGNAAAAGPLAQPRDVRQPSEAPGQFDIAPLLETEGAAPHPGPTARPGTVAGATAATVPTAAEPPLAEAVARPARLEDTPEPGRAFDAVATSTSTPASPLQPATVATPPAGIAPAPPMAMAAATFAKHEANTSAESRDRAEDDAKPRLLPQQETGPGPASGPEPRSAAPASTPVTTAMIGGNDRAAPDPGTSGPMFAGLAQSSEMAGTGYEPRLATNAPSGAPVPAAPSQQIATAVAIDRPDAAQIDVSLSPEELGQVRLRLNYSDLGLSVSITAERPETLDLLRRNIDSLARDFQELGYGDVNFSFGDQSRQDRPTPSPRAEGFGWAQGEIARGETGSAPLSPLDNRPPGSGLDLRI